MKGILPVYLLMIVVDRGKAAKAARFLQEYSCPVQLILNGHGTVSYTHLFPSFFASFTAAATLVPLEIPHIRPSLLARSFAVWIASSSVIMQISL